MKYYLVIVLLSFNLISYSQSNTNKNNPDFVIASIQGMTINLADVYEEGLDADDFTFFDDQVYYNNKKISDLVKSKLGITSKEDFKIVLIDAKNRFERFKNEAYDILNTTEMKLPNTSVNRKYSPERISRREKEGKANFRSSNIVQCIITGYFKDKSTKWNFISLKVNIDVVNLETTIIAYRYGDYWYSVNVKSNFEHNSQFPEFKFNAFIGGKINRTVSFGL